LEPVVQFSNGSVAGVGAEPFSTPQPPARRGGGNVGVSLFEGGGGQVMGGIPKRIIFIVSS
jgi:hypothetical protein